MKDRDKRSSDELITASNKITFLNKKKEKHVTELEVAYKEIAFQIEERGNRAAELATANIELIFQNEEKEKRAAELIIANKELIYQNREKEKRTKELAIASCDLLKAESDIRKLNAELEKKVMKRSAQYAFISQVNQTIVQVKDEETLFRKSCHIAIEFGKYKMAWIGGFDTACKTITLLDSCGISEQDIKLFTNVPYETNDPQDYVLRTGKHFLCNDIDQPLVNENWKTYAEEHNIGSFIVLPIKKSGSIFGTFSLYASELHFFGEEEIALLTEVTGDISFALDVFEKAKRRKDAEIQLQKNFVELEAVSQEQSAILNTLPASIALLDNKGDIVKVNEEWIHFGKSNGLHNSYTHLGKNYIEVCEKSLGSDAKKGKKMAQGLRDILKGSKAYFAMEYPCDSPTEKRWFKAEVRPFKSNLLTGAVVMHINISERKKAEGKLVLTSSALQHAIDDLNKIMDSSMDVICAVDANGVFLKVSAASKTVWGYTPEELIGTLIFDIVHQEDLQKTRLSAKNVMAGSNLNHFENRYVRKDGTLVPIEWTARWDAKDQIRYGVARDVSEKKRLEKAIENERQRFYGLFSEAPSSMGVLSGPDHVYEVVNPLYLKLIGKKDIIGKTIKEVLPEAVDQGFIELLDDVYKTGTTFSSNEMHIQLDINGNGQLVDKYLNFMYQAHRTEKNIIDGILFFAVDVTEQVLLRKKIEESEAKLKQAQALLHISNWEIDLVTNKSTWSQEYYEILGLSPEDIKPSPQAFLAQLHPDDMEFAKAKMKATFQTLEAGSFSVRTKDRNGNIAYIYTEWKFEFDTNSKPIRLYGILQDISERKIAELERSKITNDLLQRNRDLEQFTFIVSHNLRAPTANIIGFTEYLQDETLTPQEQKEFLEGLASSVSGLDNVIKDINSILQVKHEIKEKKEIVVFSKLVNDIIISIGNIIDTHNVDIKIDFTEVGDIFSLKVYLQSIFYNLIINSIKYRKPNEQPHIEIKSKKENGKIILMFKDNGLGIDMKTKGDKIFGLYKRFHWHIEGKGMGLFMVKTQVEAMGGKITVASELNKGTEFTIVFEN